MSIAFDGSESLESDSATFGLNGAHTMAVWQYSAPANYPDTLGGLVWKNADDTGFGIITSSAVVRVFIEASSFSDGTDVIPNNTWTHILYTYDDTADEVKIYINGVIDGVGTLTNTGVMSESAGGLMFGQRTAAAGKEFLGSLEDGAMWDRVLTLQEIQSLGIGKIRAKYVSNGLVVYWPMQSPPDGVYSTVAVGDHHCEDHAMHSLGVSYDLAVVGNTPTWDDPLTLQGPNLWWPTTPRYIPTMASAAATVLMSQWYRQPVMPMQPPVEVVPY